MSLKIVRFDVGRDLYVCDRDTLLKFQGSILAQMVKPEYDTRKSGLDYITIYRDGKHFGSILKYMRHPNYLYLDLWTEENLRELKEEADYYNLTDLSKRCQLQLARK